ncbi:MAG: hypothetical protein M3131_09255 [Actinomycetota bacterium]|nr:hypothetical protein [Actinomycetota bacterium]
MRALVGAMICGGVALWVGVPAGWLYVGSQVQGWTGSLGAALGVMMAGVLVSIAVIVALLGWLGRRHSELRAARGLEPGAGTALEAVMTISTGIAVLAFAAWFFLLSGASPLPTSLGF